MTSAVRSWIPLRSPEFYTERRIDLVLNSRVPSLDVRERRVRLENGKTYEYGALLIATGAEPVRLDIPGAATLPIRYLRTCSDSRAIVATVSSAKRVVVVVIEASFIGLEVAAVVASLNAAILLEPALRRHHQLRGPGREMGCDRDGRSPRGPRLDADVQAE